MGNPPGLSLGTYPMDAELVYASPMDDQNQGWSPTRGQQHFREAVEGMARSAAPLRRRVLDAYLYHLATLLDGQIPPYNESREKFAKVKDILQKWRDDPSSDPDSKDAISAATWIVEIYRTIEEYAPNLEELALRRENERLRSEIARLRGQSAQPR